MNLTPPGAVFPPKPPLSLAGIRHIALDMDGTIYKGGTLFPETVPFLASLAGLGISYSFLTNNPSKSRRDYLAHLARMGVPATAVFVADEIHARPPPTASRKASPKTVVTQATTCSCSPARPAIPPLP